ncbi:hypothetical protein CRE_23510 [Caenorhabditis remanei]|uniref:F-box domain-containing protein n=1 Tax=Caenorhabditis remanei TaxID=31234 RepID=E3MH39_CAERE|nr:hypothetical protein CRE_23510 [Caenorhabditis remanei]
MTTKLIPLLVLPYLVYAKIFRYMNPYHQISISLLSKRAKAIVKTVNTKAELITCQIGIEITIRAVWTNSTSTITRIYLRSAQDKSFSRNLDDCEIEHVDFQRFEGRNLDIAESQKWRNVSWRVKDWVDHFRDVVNKTEEFDILRFGEGSHRYDVKSVREIIGRFQQLTFNESCPEESFHQNVLVSFLPVTKQLVLTRDPHDNEIFETVLRKKFDSLEIGSRNIFHCTLNDLLKMRSRCIILNRALSTDFIEGIKGNLNQFLKLWIQNKANRNLEYMKIVSNEQILRSILEGINYQRFAGVKEQRTFIHSKNVFSMGSTRAKVNYKKFQGGLDIRRCDGKVGTLHFDRRGNCSIIQFFVWN